MVAMWHHRKCSNRSAIVEYLGVATGFSAQAVGGKELIGKKTNRPSINGSHLENQYGGNLTSQEMF